MSLKHFRYGIGSFDGDGRVVEFIGMPDSCPQCGRGQSFEGPFAVRAKSKYHCFALYQCSFSNCRQPFLGNYRVNSQDGKYYYQGNEIPNYVEPPDDVPEIICSISPDYVKIYSQSHTAEENGLYLIAGCGYRKALEFLIKDYSVMLTLGKSGMDEATPAQAKTVETIKAAQLGQVINNYLQMPRVKALAARAAWIGNDETHYERKIENGDIQVMKSLMKLVIHNIEADEEAKKLEAEIQPNR